MNILHRAQSKAVGVGMWFTTDPRRFGLVMTGLSILATVMAVIAGVHPVQSTLAGPAPGNGGGPS